jgi:hypothetical protein
MAMDAATALTHSIIDVAIARSGHGGGTFSYTYATDPNDWEYSIYQTVYDWVQEQIVFDPQFTVTNVQTAPQPDQVNTVSLTNTSDNTVDFSPSGGVETQTSCTWRVTSGSQVSVTANVGVEFPVGGSASLEVGFTGTLEEGQEETTTVTRTNQWGQSAQVPPLTVGTFTMDILRTEANALFNAVVTATLRDPGTPTLIYQDNFQGCDNVFDFSFLDEDQTSYAYNGSLQAAGSLNVNIRYSQAPIPPTARPAAPAPALASATT